MKFVAVLGVAAGLVAFPAFAGPAGHGLTFTEEVAKKNLQKRTVKVAAAASCAAPAAVELAKRDDVATAKAQEGVVRVVFHSADAAKTHEGAVRAAVSDICRAA
jgi:hypothetical protein